MLSIPNARFTMRMGEWTGTEFTIRELRKGRGITSFTLVGLWGCCEQTYMSLSLLSSLPPWKSKPPAGCRYLSSPSPGKVSSKKEKTSFSTGHCRLKRASVYFRLILHLFLTHSRRTFIISPIPLFPSRRDQRPTAEPSLEPCCLLRVPSFLPREPMGLLLKKNYRVFQKQSHLHLKFDVSLPGDPC